MPSRLESPEYRAQRDEIELLIARINGRFARPGIDAGRVHAPRHLEARARRALPARRRDDGHGAARRDEPRRAGVRALPVGARASEPLARRAAPLGARRLGAGAPGRAARQPVGRRRRRRAPRDGARASGPRAPAAARDDGRSASRRSTAGAGPRGFLTRLGAVLAARSPHASSADGRRRRSRRGSARRFARARARTILLDYDGTLREFERASRPRPADARDPRAPAIARGASGDRRPHRQRPPPPEPRAVVRAAARLPLRRARLPRPRAGRGVADARRPRPQLAAPDRAAPAASRRRRPGRARRAEVVQRRLALPPGGAASTARGARASSSTTSTSTLRARPRRSSQGIRSSRCARSGVDKGLYVRSLFPDGKEATHFVLGLGDDRTDHDLLDALPSGSVAGHVGGLLPSTSASDGRREDIHIVGPGRGSRASSRRSRRLRVTVPTELGCRRRSATTVARHDRRPAVTRRLNAAAWPRAFASRSSSSSSAPMRRRSSNSSRRCVRIISGPSVAIVKATPCSTNRRIVSRTASSSGSAFVRRFEVGQISSTVPSSFGSRA